MPHETSGTVPIARILSEYIPNAQEELNAVSDATESATVTIMNACDVIMGSIGSSPTELSHDIEKQITLIYEACTFQDIAGQRITKVIKTIEMIDEKMSVLLDIVGMRRENGTLHNAPNPFAKQSLLNGPALPNDNGLSQDAIDQLLDGL